MLHLLVDTGAAVSVISAKLRRLLQKVSKPSSDVSLRTASCIPPTAYCIVHAVIDGLLYVVELLVLCSCLHNLILGWDFLSTNHAVIDCSRAEVEFAAHCDALFIDTRKAGG